jgi:hypothetical protein
MKPPATKAIVAVVAVRSRRPQLLAIALLAILGVALTATVPLHSRQLFANPGLIAHEWGTFTAIAGSDGQPIDWLPVNLIGPPELPKFVEHFRGAAKDILRGTVRMETPVIYFYTSQETLISVHVSFSKGFITEWYPHETRLQPSTPLSSEALYEQHDDGSIAWDSITVGPNLAADFPREKAVSRYYVARETSATPLSVQTPTGVQHEKFLFYRGVSTMSLAVSAKVLPAGGILFDNLAGQPIPGLIVFERRGDKLGYHIVARPKITPFSKLPRSAARSTPCGATSKISSLRKASIPTKLRPCSKPGATPGLKKAAASSTSFRAPTWTPFFRSPLLLLRRS